MKVLYFAWIRQKIGHAEDTFADLPPGVTTVGELIAHLSNLGAGYAEAFANRVVVRAAVNQAYVDFEHPLASGDEVAFFPPVTGG